MLSLRTRPLLALGVIGALLILSSPGDALSGWPRSSAAELDAHQLARVLAAKHIDHEGYRPVFDVSRGLPSETEPNDDPDSANPVLLGDVLLADLQAGDVDYFSLKCEADGYVAFATASYEGSVTDTFLRVLSGDGTTLLAADDDRGEGLFSAVQHLACTDGETLLVEIRHFSETADGAYVLSVESSDAPPPRPLNDDVSQAEVVGCNSLVMGTTSGSTNEVGNSIACLPVDPTGGEVFYSLQLPYSNQLNVRVTPLGAFDPSLYLFTDPADPFGSCLVGGDVAFAGEDELVAYVNETEGDDLTLYVGVDSWSSASQGDFTVTVGCEIVVANERSSWGRLKARFE